MARLFFRQKVKGKKKKEQASKRVAGVLAQTRFLVALNQPDISGVFSFVGGL